MCSSIGCTPGIAQDGLHNQWSVMFMFALLLYLSTDFHRGEEDPDWLGPLGPLEPPSPTSLRRSGVVALCSSVVPYPTSLSVT